MNDLTGVLVNSFLPFIGMALLSYVVQQSFIKKFEKIEDLEKRITRIEMREEFKKELLKHEV